MILKEMLEYLKNGYKVKLPHWKGYWVLEGDKVMMYSKDGTVMNLTDTKDIIYTLTNLANNQWEVLNDDYRLDTPITTFRFGEAIRKLKEGKRVKRLDWKEYEFIYLVNESCVDKESLRNEATKAMNPTNGRRMIKINSHIDKHIEPGNIEIGWTPSSLDILAEDWVSID